MLRGGHAQNLKSERGATMTEYAVAIACVAILVIAAARPLGYGVNRVACQYLRKDQDVSQYFDSDTGTCYQMPGHLFPYW